MAFTQVAPQQNHPTGDTAVGQQAWPNGASQITLRLDVWGPNAVLNGDGSVTNPYTGLNNAFSSPTQAIDTFIDVQYAGDPTWYRVSGNRFAGQPLGTWGKPINPERQPTLSASYGPGDVLPVNGRAGYTVVSGPVRFGVSQQIQ